MRVGAASASRAGALAVWAVMAPLTLAGCSADRSTTSLTGDLEPPNTRIVEAAQCTVRQQLGRDKESDLPIAGLLGNGTVSEIRLNDQFERGNDAGDESACKPVHLDPGSTSCEQAVPWAPLAWSDMLSGLGAYRIRRASFSSDEPAKGSSDRGRLVTYVEIDILPDDPRRASALLEHRFRACANAVPNTVGGVKAMVGSIASEGSAGREVPVVAFLTPTVVAWVVLGGREWTEAETNHSLETVAARLH